MSWEHPFAEVRDQFPIFERATYLASHSLGAVPRDAAAALNEYYEQWATLGIEAWDGPWWQAVGEFEDTVERIIGAAEGTVVPMQNATRAMAAVASALDIEPARNRIVMTELEFTTSYPLWRAMERDGAELVLVKSPDGITVPVDDIVAEIDERTLIVPTCHVYFRSGAVQDLATLARAAHEHGAYVLGDGYQAVGTVPFSVTELDVDFYVGGSHKWLCGGPGAGFLYVRPDRIGELRPRITGWFGLDNPFGYETDLGAGRPADDVHRFLGGTPNIPALYAAREGLAFVDRLGVPEINKVQVGLTEAIIEGADERGLDVRTPRDPTARSGMVCLAFDDSRQATEELVRQRIVVDHRPDCGLRVSPHFYNSMDDVETFFEALDGVR